MIAKYLRHKGFQVFYLQNITDIDDKIIKRANENNEDAMLLSRRFEKEYLKDMKALGINSVTKYARATSHIKEIISQVDRLLNHLKKYQALSDVQISKEDLNVYFDLDGSCTPQEREIAIPQKSGQVVVTKSELETNVSDKDYTLFRLKHHMPVQGIDYDQEMLLNLGDEALVNYEKGCYLGQEIIARTQYRGQLKRRMVRLRAPHPLRPGQDLYSDDDAAQPSGTVVSAAGGEALAVLQIAVLESHAAVRAEAGGEALEMLPLPYAA